MNPVTWLEQIGSFAHFAFRALWSVGPTLLRPREASRQFYRVLIGALPIASLAGIAIGLVLWMHLRSVILKTPGAGREALPFLPTALSLAVILEFAPIGAGLIVAGRTGASIGAELGSMRITEQIDALEAMGQPLSRSIIGPRVLACMLALPIICVYMGVLALAGAYAAEMLTGSLTSLQFENGLFNRIGVEDALAAVLKTTVFGFLVATTSCFFGMRAEGGTEGVGRASTRSVELSTLLVLISNVLLVRVIQLLLG